MTYVGHGDGKKEAAHERLLQRGLAGELPLNEGEQRDGDQCQEKEHCASAGRGRPRSRKLCLRRDRTARPFKIRRTPGGPPAFLGRPTTSPRAHSLDPSDCTTMVPRTVVPIELEYRSMYVGMRSSA